MIVFPGGHKAISPVSDVPPSTEDSKVLAQWNEVSADGKIDLSERLNNGALWKHIEVTLGYGSVQAFLVAHDFEGALDSLNVWDQKITLSSESKEAISASIEGSINNAKNYLFPNLPLHQVNDQSGWVICGRKKNIRPGAR